MDQLDSIRNLHELMLSSKESPERDINRFSDLRMNQVNPYIRFASYSILSPRNVVGPRIIYDYEIIFVKAGHAVFTINGIRYQAKPGDMFFLRPGVEHSIEMFDESLIQPHIHFDLTWDQNSAVIPISFVTRDRIPPEMQCLIRKDDSDIFFPDFPDHFRPRSPLRMEQLLYDVIYSYVDVTLFNELKLKQKFLGLLNYILMEIYWDRIRGTPRLKRDDLAQRTRIYLEHNLQSRVAMEELSAQLHFDRAYISRCFRRTYGASPIHYHLRKRIQYAKGMIIYTNLSLSAIAEQSAFSSLQDFSRAFRRIEGCSPSDLRK